MKKNFNKIRFLAAGIISMLSFNAHAQFTAGNLVVYDIDNSITTSAQATLREFSPTGTAVSSINVPTSGAARLTNSGSSVFEGSLTRSSDGRHLVFGGYDAGTGVLVINLSNTSVAQRVIDTVNRFGAIGRAAATNSYNGFDFVGAAKASTNNYYGAGFVPIVGTGGVRYFGYSSSASVITNVITREVKVINDKLYGVTATEFFTYSTALPTSASTRSILFDITLGNFSSFSVNQAGTVAFIGDASLGIRKLVKTGSTWSQSYIIASTDVRHLTVDWANADATGSGAIIYYTTDDALPQIRKLTDNGTTNPTVTLLATAQTGSAYRGIEFAPVEPCSPAVTIQSNASGNNICSGGSITFSVASSSNLGTTPRYQWNVNGSPVAGATNATFTTTTLSNNNTVSLTVTGTAPCIISGATITSSAVTVGVSPNVTPTVTIQSNDADNSICANASVTFSVASSTNLGAAPTYQWRRNSTNIPNATNATYTTSGLANNDAISLVVTSNATCLASATATSNSINTAVTPNVTPTVVIQSNDGDNSICAGASITFSVASSSGLGTPTYQWRRNSSNIANATNATYTTTTLADGDQISLVATSSLACVTQATATSVAIAVNVVANVTPAVAIQSNRVDNSVCDGSSIMFSISSSANLGVTPGYQWNRNNTPVTNATNATYTSALLADNDQISLTVTSSATCLTAPTATSNSVTVDVVPVVVPTVSISFPDTICYRSQSAFTATGTNLGSAPVYTWIRDGRTVPDTNGNQYITSNISVQMPEEIIVVVSNINVTCAASTVSDTISVKAVGTPNPAIEATGSRNFCAGGSVILANEVNAAATNLEYTWVKNGSTVVSNNNSYTATESGQYQLTIRNTETGCVRTSTVQTVNSKPLPVVNPVISGPLVLCDGASVTFNTDSAAGYIIRWRRVGREAAVGVASSYTTKTEGTYYVTATLSGCMVTSDSFEVATKTTSASITADGPTSFCAPGSVNLSVVTQDPDYTYKWYRGASIISSATSINATTTANYRVVVTNGTCPSKESNIIAVESITPPIVTVGRLLKTNAYWRLMATSNNIGSSYQWYLFGAPISGATDRTYDATADGSYTVKASRGTCTDSTTSPYIVNSPTFRTTASMIENNIMVYPNPSEGLFLIGSSVPVNVIVKDVQGRTVAEAKNAAQVDISNQPGGMYMMMISDLKGNLLQVERVTKK